MARLRTGQAATEYLIILAVVVILALIVVAALGGFRGIAGGMTRQQSEVFWSTAEIGIEPNYRVSPAKAELTIKNNRPFTVKVTGIYLDGGGTMTPSSVTLVQGGTANVNVSGVGCSTGSQYAFKILITYQDPQTARTFSVAPDTPLVGNCQ